MWDGILNWILRRVVDMRSKDLGIDRYDNTTDVSRWTAIYEGRPSWQVLNPVGRQEYVTSELNAGATIVSELARLTTIEMESTISGGERSEYYNEQYQRVIENLRENVEYALAKGGMVMRPYVDNGRILVEFVQAGEFIPLKFDDTGKMTSVCFVDSIEKNKQVYNKLEIHELHDDGMYTIEHKVYIGSSASLDKGMELKSFGFIEEWRDLAPYTEFSADTIDGNTLFSYFKPPFANNKNSNSNLGVSVFSKIEGLLERLDRQHSRVVYEYESKKPLIIIDRSYIDNLNIEDRERVQNDPKYQVMDSSRSVSSKEASYQVYSPSIEDAPVYRAVNETKRDIELNVGLAYGTLSEVNVVAKTATEVMASKERSYSTVQDVQKSLAKSLRDLVVAMIMMDNANRLLGQEDGLTESTDDYEVGFKFDDSIINDRKSKQEKLVTAIDKGYLHPKRFLMQEFGMTEEQALAELEDAKDYKKASAKNGTPLDDTSATRFLDA